MVEVLITVVYIIVCIVLILVVLLQTGKRADLAGAFGGGGSQTAFGARGAATFLSKATTTAAVLYMVLALALSIMGGRGADTGSVLDQVAPVEAGTPAPATPTDPLATSPPDAGTGNAPADDTPDIDQP